MSTDFASVARAPGVRPRYSSVELLVVLVVFFGLTPFIEDMPRGDLIEALAMSIVLISAMLAVRRRRETLLVGLGLVVPALVSRWLAQLYPHSVPSHIHLAFGLLFVAFVVLHQLRFIIQANSVNAEILCAGLSGYLMLGILWALGYLLVALVSPAAFSFGNSKEKVMGGFDAFYFSFVTLSTVGFGDVTPISKVARTMAVMEAVSGTFYVTVLIARLVAMYSPVKDSSQPPSN